MQGLADAAGDRGARAHHVAGLRADHQVGVALPDPGLLAELLVQGRQRTQRLARQRPVGRQHRQLAALATRSPGRSRTRSRRGRRRPSTRPARSSPTSARDSITCSRTPESAGVNPSWRVAKQSLPVLRMKTTRPLTLTTSVGLLAGGRGGPTGRAPAAALCVRGTAIG